MPLLLWVWLILCCCGWVCSAPDAAQSHHLTVGYGQSVLLPCDGSAYLDEDYNVQWEAMGSDVAALGGDSVDIHNTFKDRLRFASMEERNAGNWSIVLDNLRLSDTDMYECIWAGRRTLSTVWLTVELPQVEHTVKAYWNESVTLPCYLDIPRNQSPNDLRVWWEEANNTIFEKQEDTLWFSPEYTLKSSEEQQIYLRPENIDKFHLYLSQNTTDRFNGGEYHCWYQTKESDELKAGIPGTIYLTVMYFFPDTVTNENTTIDEWGSTLYWATDWTADGVEGSTMPESTTGETPVLIDEVTEPMEVITEPLPMKAFDETMTSFPDELSPVTPESSDWDDFPWVRTGLIACVLLATAVVLCILGALHKL